MKRATAGNLLYDFLLGADADREGGAPFLILPGGGRLTRAGFAEVSARLSARLLALGARKGDRVACRAEKSPEALALCVACARVGMVFVPLNTAYTPPEVDYFVGDARPAVFVCDENSREALHPLARKVGAVARTLNADGGGTLTDGLDREAPVPPAPCGADDPACALYTSGTTGRPKGAVLTHRNLESNARTLAKLWRFSPEDVLLHMLPIFHVHGLFTASFTMLAARGAMIFAPKFDAAEAARLLPGATAMMGVPTYYSRLLSLSESEFNRDSAKGVRVFISGSAPLPESVHAAFEERTGHRILERYGMSETGMMASNPVDGERRPGAVGFPLPEVEMRITDEKTGEELSRGEAGMIEARGPNIFKEYWRMPEKTRAAFRDDGFFVTGDLGRFDEDGYLRIVGRVSDMIVTGGLNLYPSETEAAMNALPGVSESAVVGAPHPDFGEGAVAFVVPEKNAAPDEEGIVAALRGKLANFKIPKRVFLIDALPRNTMGKVQKNILRERCRDVFGEG